MEGGTKRSPISGASRANVLTGEVILLGWLCLPANPSSFSQAVAIPSNFPAGNQMSELDWVIWLLQGLEMEIWDHTRGWNWDKTIQGDPTKGGAGSRR